MSILPYTALEVCTRQLKKRRSAGTALGGIAVRKGLIKIMKKSSFLLQNLEVVFIEE